MKLKPFSRGNKGEVQGYDFMCPGCGYQHRYITRYESDQSKAWSFNGDMERPTFVPSLLYHKTDIQLRCHCFVTDGQIQYCQDSEHSFAGKTIDMVDVK